MNKDVLLYKLHFNIIKGWIMNENKKKFSEESKIVFYENYFNNDDYDVFRNDVGSFCTRKIILKHIANKTGNILEIGTGLSSLLEDLPSFNRYGLDISTNTISAVKNIFDNKGILANFIVADAEKIPFDSDFFDVIVSSHTLEHIKNDNEVLKECARILKPGGEIIFFVPGRIDGTATKEEWLKLGHYRSYNLKRFKDLEREVEGLLMLKSIKYPHKIHNLVWNRFKHIIRWINYPIKKWIMRDNKTYEIRPMYKNFILPLFANILDFADSFTFKKEKNLFGTEFNVLARFEKIHTKS